MCTKKNRILSLLLAGTACMSMMTAGAGAAYAADSGTGNTSVYLVAEADTSVTPIDYTISESISLKAQAKTINTTEDTIKLKNNGTENKLAVTEIEAVAQTGWTMKDYKRSEFRNQPVNSQIFAACLWANDDNPLDLMTAAENPATVNASETLSIPVYGMTSIRTQASNDKVCEIVTTISMA